MAKTKFHPLAGMPRDTSMRADVIVKSLPHAKPDFVLDTRSEMIGDTLFINGVPHKVCGKCGVPVGSSEGIRTNISGRKVEIRPYKITVMVGWKDEGDEIVYEDGFPTIKRHKRPIIMQRLGCFDCWNTQQMRKNGAHDKEWMYDIRECVNPEKGK